MSTQAIVKVADTKVADGEATVAIVYFPGEHAAHVVCSCCGTLSTDTFATDADSSDTFITGRGGGEAFVARWNANVRANAHAEHGVHRAGQVGGAR